MKRTKILYIHNGLSSFVKKDIQILEEEFDLKLYYFNPSIKSQLPLVFFRQFLFLFWSIWKAKVIVVQFAGYHSFLPVLFGRLCFTKVIIVMGGTDSVSFPSIQYGCFYNKYMRFFTSFSIKKASLLLPVSETLVLYNYTYDESDFPQQGYLFHLKNAKTAPHKTIPFGYSADEWPYSKSKEKMTFITVAADLSTRFGPKLKGIDLIIEIAPRFPDCTFFIVGGDKLTVDVPSNVKKIGNMPHEELKKVVAGKQFYLQLSMSEGFPNALCEAMLTGCIPIVSNAGAMPMIVADSGFVLEKKNIDLLEDLISRALNSNFSELSIKARNRIAENFTFEKRKVEFVNAVKSTA